MMDLDPRHRYRSKVKRRQLTLGIILFALPVVVITICASWPDWWRGLLYLAGVVSAAGCVVGGLTLIFRSMD